MVDNSIGNGRQLTLDNGAVVALFPLNDGYMWRFTRYIPGQDEPRVLHVPVSVLAMAAMITLANSAINDVQEKLGRNHAECGIYRADTNG